MVPDEILEEIFAYLSRDALDYCEIICLKWSKVIETSKRLTQRRIINFCYYYPYDENNTNERFLCVQLISSTGKTIHIVDDPNHQEFPASQVFKNIIIDKFEEHFLTDIGDLVEQWMKIVKLAGVRIIIKSVYVGLQKLMLTGHIVLKRVHDLFTKYIDVYEIKMSFNGPKHEDKILFNKESWKYFDFGKNTQFNLHYYTGISPNDFSNDIFKEFISGKHMAHTKLNKLEIYSYGVEEHVIIHSIVEVLMQNLMNSIDEYTKASNSSSDRHVLIGECLFHGLDSLQRRHSPKKSNEKFEN